MGKRCDATTEDIRAACVRLLGEPQFRTAGKRLGDLVAAEAEGSTLVQELEATAAYGRSRRAPA
jgi:hypothetical protein